MYGVKKITIKIRQRIEEIGYQLIEAQALSDKGGADESLTKPVFVLVNQTGKPASTATLKNIAALIKNTHAVDVVFDVKDAIVQPDESSPSPGDEGTAEQSPPGAGLQSPVYRQSARAGLGRFALADRITSWHLLEAVISQMSIGVFLVDEKGNVPFYNEMADQMLSENSLWSRKVSDINEKSEGVDADADKGADKSGSKEMPYLSLNHPLARDIVDRVCLSKHRTAVLTAKEEHKLVLDPRPPCQGLDQMVVCPLRSKTGSVAVVFAYDFSYHHHDLIKALRSYHGFSLGEAKVTAMLLRTTDTKAVASELFISVETVRSYMKIIFNKTNTNSRQKLIKMLAGGAVGSLRP